jgi:hypothetical protein
MDEERDNFNALSVAGDVVALLNRREEGVRFRSGQKVLSQEKQSFVEDNSSVAHK